MVGAWAVSRRYSLVAEGWLEGRPYKSDERFGRWSKKDFQRPADPLCNLP
jgi:hypothetical protein